MSWQKRKRGSSNQRGQPFLTDPNVTTRRVSGDLRRDVLRERYLQTLAGESKTHDINEVSKRLIGQGKQARVSATQDQKDVDIVSKDLAKATALMDVIGEVLGNLERIQQTGRTRVGDSELRMMVRSVLQRKGLDPTLIDV